MAEPATASRPQPSARLSSAREPRAPRSHMPQSSVPQRIAVVLHAPPPPADLDPDGQRRAQYSAGLLGAFRSAGVAADSLDDLDRLGVYVTVATLAQPVGNVVPLPVVKEHAVALDLELRQLTELAVILAMGDTAIAAVNEVSRLRCGKRTVPAGSTYRLRDGVYHLGGVRVLPSYLPTGASFLIERSKREMVTEDIRTAFRLLTG